MEVGGRYKDCWTRTFIQACLIVSRFSMQVFFSHKYFSCFHRQLVAGGDGGERQVQSLDKDFYIFLYFSCFSSFPRQLLLDWWQVVMEGSGR